MSCRPLASVGLLPLIVLLLVTVKFSTVYSAKETSHHQVNKHMTHVALFRCNSFRHSLFLWITFNFRIPNEETFKFLYSCSEKLSFFFIHYALNMRTVVDVVLEHTMNCPVIHFAINRA